ncbi:Heparan-alpha-glucosaminide N-acetyltransferase [Morella rubra]|uniref:Heparan-alpha-glucosaminide N-acetyltransferase n=1 Tax=Morella rubra TaxID=262757 RepID=A0A6A1VP80_9ROSI|nr:Heparan-alpha-glucosaminide N-acetyltransferase [Morella rubra]
MAVHARSTPGTPDAGGAFSKIEEEGPKQKQHQLQLQQHHHPKQRLVSLDVFRGITVAVVFPSPNVFSPLFNLMILVDDAGGLLPALNHSPWNGLTVADLFMPFFLFIVGISLALTYKKVSCRADATSKAILRALKLLILELFLQGGFFHGLNNLTYGVIDHIRWMGILQYAASFLAWFSSVQMFIMLGPITKYFR